MTSAIFFIAGLIVGSFLNVVICRLRWAEEFVTGRSKCPACKNMIGWYDNIPLLSFALLGAKCRSCRKNISWQYPLVEFFTAFFFAIVGAWVFDPMDAVTWIRTVFLLGVISFLTIIFVYDILYMEVPGAVLWISIGWAIAGNLALDWQMQGKTITDIFTLATYSGALAASAAFAFFLSIVLVSREKWMGMGDAYLAILLGLFLGWPKILLALFLAFALGAIIGLLLIAFKKKTMKSQVPFAPFLVAGSVVSVFLYNPIVNWYFGLLTG